MNVLSPGGRGTASVRSRSPAYVRADGAERPSAAGRARRRARARPAAAEVVTELL